MYGHISKYSKNKQIGLKDNECINCIRHSEVQLKFKMFGVLSKIADNNYFRYCEKL